MMDFSGKPATPHTESVELWYADDLRVADKQTAMTSYTESYEVRTLNASNEWCYERYEAATATTTTGKLGAGLIKGADLTSEPTAVHTTPTLTLPPDALANPPLANLIQYIILAEVIDVQAALQSIYMAASIDPDMPVSSVGTLMHAQQMLDEISTRVISAVACVKAYEVKHGVIPRFRGIR